MAFRSQLRVYYQDTDAGGVMFHANYLNFFERARTEWLRHSASSPRAGRSRRSLFIVRDADELYEARHAGRPADRHRGDRAYGPRPVDAGPESCAATRRWCGQVNLACVSAEGLQARARAARLGAALEPAWAGK